MIIRQLFYAMLGLPENVKLELGGFKNDEHDYKRVSRMMKKARMDGRIPWDWIVDRSRPTYEPQVWDDLDGYKATIKRRYRKDYWTMQPRHVELWCEKDGVAGSVEDLTDELGVRVRTSRGFQSMTKVHEIALLFAKIRKPKTVFFLGDWDPCGEDIERDVHARVQAQGSGFFDIQRLAIFKADIKKFNLPPQRVKPDDTRSPSFRKRHGDDCVELDALPPAELRSRIRKAIESVIDWEKWDRAISAEEAEIASIDEVVRKWATPGA